MPSSPRRRLPRFHTTADHGSLATVVIVALLLLIASAAAESEKALPCEHAEELVAGRHRYSLPAGDGGSEPPS